MNRVVRLILAGGAFCLLLAQEPPPLRVTVNLVQVDAVVTDKAGRHIPDLTKDDFKLFQDGKPQAISYFSYVAGMPPPQRAELVAEAARGVPAEAEPVAAVASPPSRERIQRTVALVVDDLGLSWRSMHSVKAALSRFVNEQVRPGDLVAILRTGFGIGSLQQFTTDKLLLHTAISRLGWNFMTRDADLDAPIEDERASDPDSPSRHDPPMNPDRIRAQAYTLGTVNAVDYVIESLRRLPGRKSLVIFSDGISLFQAAEDKKSATTIALHLRRLIDRANRAAVTIYTINARGLEYLGLTAGDRVRSTKQAKALLAQRNAAYKEREEGMALLARETGGISYNDTNDLAGAARQAMEDQVGYLLGYSPPPDTFRDRKGESVFHSLKVRVTRPGCEVRARSGFFNQPDVPPPPARKGAKPQLMEAIQSPLHAGRIRLRLTALFGHTAATGPSILAILHIDGRTLTFREDGEGWRKAVVDVAVVSFGEDGTAAESTVQTQDLRLRAGEMDAAVRNGLVYKVTHRLAKPGAFQIRAAVRDTFSEEVGTAAHFVEVPDVRSSCLTLSGIMMSGLDGTTQQAENTAVASEEGVAVRRFGLGQRISYSFEIYRSSLPSDAAETVADVRVRVFQEGRLVWSGEWNPVSFDSGDGPRTRHISRELRFGPDSAPGNYMLQVVAREKADGKPTSLAVQWQDFELLPR